MGGDGLELRRIRQGRVMVLEKTFAFSISDCFILNSIDLRKDGKARTAKKRPVPVMVRFAKSDGDLATREGLVRYIKGDALLTGLVGDSWPVARDNFLDRYEAESGTQHGEDGTYMKRPLSVLVKRLDCPVAVAVGQSRDPIEGLPGDWLVQYAPGEHGIVSQDIFESTYALDPPGSEAVKDAPLLDRSDLNRNKD
jgi:hypothetical protein